MTFAQLALANVRGSWMRYAAFFLSSTFSVLLFYLYAQFVFHPDLATGQLYGGDMTRTVLAVCMVLVALFAFLFVLYSAGAFLRARNQEFGLLTLMGTTRRQLRRLIWLENTFLSLAAIAAGLVLGVLLSRLFLLAIARVLAIDEALRFTVVPQAVLLTVAGFFVLFQFVTLTSSGLVGRRQVIQLLNAARRPSEPPRSSPVLAVLGLLLVAGGYTLALRVQTSADVALAFLPTVGMVVVGTYLLFSQVSLAVLKRLQRPGSGYLSGTRMLVVSQLAFRMRDNAQLLATIATLSAVVLAAAGTFYSVTQQLAADTAIRFPQPFVLLEPVGGEGHLSAATVDRILAEHGVTPTLRGQIEVRALRASTSGAEASIVLVPRGQLDALPTPAPSGRAIDAEPMTMRFVNGVAHLETGADAQGITIEPVASPVSQLPVLFGDWYAVPDAEFAALPAGDPLTSGTITAYDWEGANDLGAERSGLGAAMTQAVPAE